ncbi:YitT family protein [Clostridium sp. MSJ-8]|uniref:YitT family protein n=1 Tax=Clostridium sp. MSJ-8 TaxID=2841510 RepID=UPI001C0EAD19|nr:YitT family protein [Clostridium sp. MSJ-8]MBU5488327.1 YitT family protein [Clostridium sp. MSJ-8]
MKIFREWVNIIIGVILIAISIELFFVPNNLAGGGVTGLAIVLNKLFPFMSVSIITLIFNVFLFFIAFKLLGGEFGKKSVITTILLSIFMYIIEKVMGDYVITKDILIATIFGTIISALGTAIVFNNNSSTGGTDILAKILQRFFHVNIGMGLLVIDFLITIIAMIVFGIDSGLYSVLSVLILGMTVDRFIDGFNSVKEVFIVSSEYKDISVYIMNELDRGCTYLNGEGAFTGKSIKIIYTLLGRNEFIKLKKYLQDNNSDAIISVWESCEVMGNGFRNISEM